MPTQHSHNCAVLLMICAATLWSMAGVLTRNLDSARGFEITFWRSIFAALFVLGALFWQQRRKTFSTLRAMGRLSFLSGAMWGIMFICFMIALTMTTVANTLIVMSISPLLTAFLSWLFLHQKVAHKTWLAIIFALIGMIWMFAKSLTHVSDTEMLGIAIALGVPLAASVNVITLKKAGHAIDLVPSVLLGGVFSAAAMLPLALPFQATQHDLIILAILGFFQLGFPCMLMVIAARSLAAPEISLLALLEVLLGPIWAWLGAGEIPAKETLIGGAIVLVALILNEAASMRKIAPSQTAF